MGAGNDVKLLLEDKPIRNRNTARIDGAKGQRGKANKTGRPLFRIREIC